MGEVAQANPLLNVHRRALLNTRTGFSAHRSRSADRCISRRACRGAARCEALSPPSLPSDLNQPALTAGTGTNVWVLPSGFVISSRVMIWNVLQVPGWEVNELDCVAQRGIAATATVRFRCV